MDYIIPAVILFWILSGVMNALARKKPGEENDDSIDARLRDALQDIKVASRGGGIPPTESEERPFPIPVAVPRSTPSVAPPPFAGTPSAPIRTAAAAPPPAFRAPSPQGSFRASTDPVVVPPPIKPPPRAVDLFESLREVAREALEAARAELPTPVPAPHVPAPPPPPLPEILAPAPRAADPVPAGAPTAPARPKPSTRPAPASPPRRSRSNLQRMVVDAMIIGPPRALHRDGPGRFGGTFG